jgi:RNA-directed DNA polymerase
MEMERRTLVIQSSILKQLCKEQGKMMREETKALPVSKGMVYDSYLKVIAKNGGAGIDGESISMFKKDVKGNLYKLWNRLTSGSYFPPAVRTVFIPKKAGGQRPLGIPTVSDRIAQGVVKDYLEPQMENIFHKSSFGYRPGRSAHDALAQCRANCFEYAWVIDVDIKGFFDNISHEIMLQLLSEHTQEKWVLMYIERWLKAGVEQEDGDIVGREKGTPQGGVISPLLANLYLHHAFDKWMDRENPKYPFERYADDIVIHCRSKEKAEELLLKLKKQMDKYELTLHPEKTKIVYCKDDRRAKTHEHESFTFLSYTFQPRQCKAKLGALFLGFTCAISNQAAASIRDAIKAIFREPFEARTMVMLAKTLNPKIRGWVNYYTKFARSEGLRVFKYLNNQLLMWIARKYKIKSYHAQRHKFNSILKENPKLFHHWELGIKLFRVTRAV